LDDARDVETAPGEWLQSDVAIRAYVRETAGTVFNPVGTCAMGNDGSAVVNHRLQVHGIQALRVVDAAVMPTLVGGNTNAPVFMIAEKAADMIKLDAE
jgi:choline dehydrogenase